VTLQATSEAWPRPTPKTASSPSLNQPALQDHGDDRFTTRLKQAIRAFVVQRGRGRTVIAGYPWFLDWGRDTLICARGLLDADGPDEVEQLLSTFGRFEQNGTLPNTIHGEDATNRDTSDAPLWFGVVCEEWSARVSGQNDHDPNSLEHEPMLSARRALYDRAIDDSGRTLADVLRSIATHYARGTPNGVAMDSASGLIWSPPHFTWMDTNHPACTPREGYPIEIQVLWIRLLRQLARLSDTHESASWTKLARQAETSFQNLYWLEEQGWWADVLHARPGVPAARATADDALRSNALLAVSLDLATGERAQRTVEAACRHLAVPGAVRSVAPLPVRCPLEIRGADGRLLNDPRAPYWGRYEGDEDTRRKPAYHNGTAWTWMLPSFAEALAKAWNRSPESLSAAKSYLLSLVPLLDSGCLGQLPEILDGDAPHHPRGCDAQAWTATEALRVWRWLDRPRERR
jgi:glycogen debranching enzyme